MGLFVCGTGCGGLIMPQVIQIDRQKDSLMGRWIDKWIDGWLDGWIDGWTDGWIDR